VTGSRWRGRSRLDLRGATGLGRGKPGQPGALIRPVEFAHRPGSATVLFARRAPPSGQRPQGRKCGRGSVGRASPCQGEGRGFESRRPLGDAERRRDQPDGSRVPSRAFSSVASTAVRRKTPLAEWPSGLGKGLQSPLHGFDSRLRLASPGRLAQRESASLTRKRSLVQSQYRPPIFRKPVQLRDLTSRYYRPWSR
jgi:hypothetical protein